MYGGSGEVGGGGRGEGVGAVGEGEEINAANYLLGI